MTTEVYEQFRSLMFDNLEEFSMNVTAENYGALAWRTAKQLTPTNMLLHGALGLLTEVSELAEAGVKVLSEDHIKKELGDIVWFCNYIYTSRFGVFLSLAPIEPDTPNSLFTAEVFRMFVSAGEVGTLIKAAAFYGKALDDYALRGGLLEVLRSVHAVCTGMGFSFDNVLQMNIEKLRLRYPDQYTDIAAIARADEVPSSDEILSERSEDIQMLAALRGVPIPENAHELLKEEAYELVKHPVGFDHLAGDAEGSYTAQ